MTVTRIYAPRALVPVPEDLDRPAFRAALLTVEGARITEVVVDPVGPPPPDADILAPPLILAPAFVDAHTHLALHALRGAATHASTRHNLVTDVFFRAERAMSAEDVRAFSRMGALEAILSGTAVVHDHYYHAHAVVQALQDTGLAGHVAPALQDLTGPGADHWEAALEATARIDDAPSLRSRGIGAMLGPHASDTVSDALWQRIANLANDRNLPIHTHISQSLQEEERSRSVAGCSPLERIARTGALEAGPAWLLVHGLFLSPDFSALLDADRHTLVACLRSQARFAFPSDVILWWSHGWPFAVGSDAAASNDGLSVQSELAVLAAQWPSRAVHTPRESPAHDGASLDRARSMWATRTDHHDRAPAPYDLWRAATEIPGGVHPAFPAGALKPGHMAHLAVWDTRHPALWPGDDPWSGLVYGNPQGALAQLMVSGRWLGPRGCGAFQSHVLHHPDVAEWVDEASARRRALWKRAGLS